ncbi:hypothetical protein BRC90_04730 [Halobacteriales archaeon QS_4_69_34]|nr:MAG: hypothetical protein BRC90_04730 [Halobacteriales archaeon QS_4_69_34]
MSIGITADHEGNPVFNADEQRIGIVASVEHGTAYVNPDPNILEEFGAKFGWERSDQETHPLAEEQIETVTDDEIVLRSDL